MLSKMKFLLISVLVVLLSLNFTTCFKDNNKATITSKATTQELSDANVELFCKVELKDAEVDALKMVLDNHKSVNTYKLVTKEEQVKKAAKLFGSEKLFEGENATILPASFIVRLSDARTVDDFYNEFKADSRIDKIKKINKENKSK
ncbi:MAG: permease-like cell division protein FtsX [Clostridia bacterium]|nr:permease-like cell division protein FtsX [Clostridia bacterium]